MRDEEQRRPDGDEPRNPEEEQREGDLPPEASDPASEPVEVGGSEDPGVWLPTDDERLPDWLRPFNGDVLVALEGGEVAAGVGRKQHDRHGHELAVVTEEGHRGRGWARRLVTQAARRVLDDGAVPTYLHAPDNVASARTADASGFPDVGWTIFGLFGAVPD